MSKAIICEWPTCRLFGTHLVRHRETTCYYCGKSCEKHGWTRDHIVPRCQGGMRTVLCCGPCNQHKGRLSANDWRAVLAFRAGVPVGDFEFHGESPLYGTRHFCVGHYKEVIATRGEDPS